MADKRTRPPDEQEAPGKGDDAFQDLLDMQGVQHLKPRHKNLANVRSTRQARFHKEVLETRRKAAATPIQSLQGKSRTSDGRVEPVSPSQSLLFALNDIDQRLIARLKRGEIEWQEGLDLHGYTVEEARVQVESFLRDAESQHWRCVLIVHGKAWSMASGFPVIKSHVNAWLREWPTVIAFSSATPEDGGTGAVYVLMKRYRGE